VARRTTLGVRVPPPKEVSLHITVAGFLRRAWPPGLPWFHVPNGEVRDKATAGKLYAMGVRAGVPDFVFVMPNGQAAFLELKRDDDSDLSAKQIEFRNEALSCGCGYAVARTPEEAEAVLRRWAGVYGLRLRATMGGRAAA
jgi:hypothetical protein